MADDDFTPLGDDAPPADQPPVDDAPPADQPPDPDAKFNALAETVNKLAGLAKPFLDNPQLVYDLQARALQAPQNPYPATPQYQPTQAEAEAKRQKDYQDYIQDPVGYGQRQAAAQAQQSVDPLRHHLANLAVSAYRSEKAANPNFKFAQPIFDGLANEARGALAQLDPVQQRNALDFIWRNAVGTAYETRQAAQPPATRASGTVPNLGGGKGSPQAARPYGNRDQAAVDHLKSMGFSDQDILDTLEEEKAQ